MCGNQVASEWPTAQAQRLEELYCGRRNSFERTEGTSPGGSRVGEGAAVKRCQQFEAIPTYHWLNTGFCHFDGYCSRDMVQPLQQSHHVSFNIFKMSIPFAWHFNMFHHTSTYFSIFQPVKDVTAVACQDTISQFPHASCRARMTSWWRRPGVSWLPWAKNGSCSIEQRRETQCWCWPRRMLPMLPVCLKDGGANNVPTARRREILWGQHKVSWLDFSRPQPAHWFPLSQVSCL